MKAGLEIHQQLKTGKLFCRCPSILREDKPDILVARKLRPVSSETGARDAVSEAEAAKNKTFFYEAYSDTTCLVEVDEEPPMEIDGEALELAVSIGKSLNCSIVPELHTMRKAIIDGSCPGGFQRTALLGRGGWIEVNGKRIGIDTICIEEDAGRIINSDEAGTTFRVDRLGIPLVEIATAPDISSPEEAKEVARKIGTILRLTGKVRRGIGSIRQDLNVSIPEGTRVEIKGMQDLDMMPLYCENEIKRQEAIIGIAKKYKLSAQSKEIDATSVFEKTQSKVLAGKRIMALVFPGLTGLMKEPLHEGRHFGKEVADRVRILTRAKGFFHTDELPAYGVTAEEVSALRAFLKAGEKDLVCLVADESSALKVIADRISLISSGVLKETRKANPDGSTSFLRQIAGSARFYPETDISPTQMKGMIEKARVVESPEKRLASLKKMGLSDQVAGNLLLSENYPLFAIAIDKGVQPILAATIVEETLTSLRRKGIGTDSISDSSFSELFESISKGKILRDAVPAAIETLSKGGELSSAASLTDESEVVAHVRKLISDKKEFIEKNGERAFQGLMGELMGRFRGKFDGAKLKEILQRELAARK